MKKIMPSALFIVTILWQQTVVAQSRQQAEIAFTDQLNTILKKSQQQHWSYEGVMTIDSAFAISSEGILSVTVRYSRNSGYTITRMAAPVSKIQKVFYDFYLILQYNGNDVQVFESLPGSDGLQEGDRTYLFHIGAPEPEDITLQKDLQQLLDQVLKHYQR